MYCEQAPIIPEEADNFGALSAQKKSYKQQTVIFWITFLKLVMLLTVSTTCSKKTLTPQLTPDDQNEDKNHEDCANSLNNVRVASII